MQRRTWLKLGLASAAGLALLGGGLALQRPALSAGRLLPAGRAIFEAVGAAVLEGCLPEGGPVRQAALQGLLARALQAFLVVLDGATLADLMVPGGRQGGAGLMVQAVVTHFKPGLPPAPGEGGQIQTLFNQ